MIKRLLFVLIRGYQLMISPMIPPRCRYIPTCSQYAIEALQTHGTVSGSFYAVKRICRCHPWGGFGYDPVPSKTAAYHFYPLAADIALIYTLEYRKKYLKYQLFAEFE